MLLVGLTGGIGSGKSTVAALLAEHGAIVIDADRVARDLQSPGSPMLERMAERFGDHVIGDDGALDRAAVAAQVFGESETAKAALADLNAITHPAIQREIERRLVTLGPTDEVVVLDHPLLGDHPRDDLAATIVVDVPTELAIQRLVEHRGMDETDARNRVASQISREERSAIATHIVDNSSDLDHLRSEVASLWDSLVELRAERSSA